MTCKQSAANRLPEVIKSYTPKEKEPGKTKKESFRCVGMNRSTIVPNP
jgi:hypothetical protein